MILINTIINTPDDLLERVNIRTEFIDLGITKILQVNIINKKYN